MRQPPKTGMQENGGMKDDEYTLFKMNNERQLIVHYSFTQYSLIDLMFHLHFFILKESQHRPVHSRYQLF
jgi:hypothetical protein